jgi:hypothetical protein
MTTYLSFVNNNYQRSTVDLGIATTRKIINGGYVSQPQRQTTLFFINTNRLTISSFAPYPIPGNQQQQQIILPTEGQIFPKRI